MKAIVILAVCVAVVVAIVSVLRGNASVDNELIGQAKKIIQNTPVFCSNYKSLDISLGVTRGGTGSMSTQDVLLTVTNEQDLATIKHAVDIGAIVKVRYNSPRWAPCSDDDWMTSIEIVP